MHTARRPGKRDPAPAPIYLHDQNAPYCLTCGRVMSNPKARQGPNIVKYCSDGCRSRKPSLIDRQIEKLIIGLLNSEHGSGPETNSGVSRRRKGDPRVQISCDEIQNLFFGEKQPSQEPLARDSDAQKYGQQRAERRERVRRAARRAVVFGLPDDRDTLPPGTTGPGKTEGMAEPTRGNVWKPGERSLRLCEAVVDNVVVEPSFAKGDWCIRWRE